MKPSEWPTPPYPRMTEREWTEIYWLNAVAAVAIVAVAWLSICVAGAWL